jgi:uncharacterized protein HemX
MEEKTVAPTPAPAVMDVIPPAEPVAPSPPPEAETESEAAAPDPAPAPPAAAKADTPKPPAPKPAQEPSSHVTAAIMATVVIVLGLSALAVVAYLKSR